MPVNLINLCDCSECKSIIIEFDGINILCNLPSRLLYEFDIDEPTSPLYNKFKSSYIHIILITKASGLDGIEILRHYYNLRYTHIVCTRPVYTINYIYFNQHINSILTNCNLNRCYNKNLEIRNKILRRCLRGDGQMIRPFMIENKSLINDSIHLLSYNEILKLKIPIYSDDKFYKISKSIKLCPYSSGYTLGGCNWTIESSNLPIKIAIVADCFYSSNERYPKPLDFSFVQTTNTFIILGDGSYTKDEGTSSDVDVESRTSCNEVYPKDEVTPSDVNVESKTSCNKSYPEDKEYIKMEKAVKIEEENPKNENTSTLNNPLSLYPISPHQPHKIPIMDNSSKFSSLCDKIMNMGESDIIIPIDPYCEVMIDILEYLYNSNNGVLSNRQFYIYCIGECMNELFIYINKCCEWVNKDRGDNTMDFEEPKTPFIAINDMIESNKLFIGNTLNDIQNVYRSPSILLITTFINSHLLDFIDTQLNYPHNNFIIIHEKYYKLLNLINRNANIINHFININTSYHNLIDFIYKYKHSNNNNTFNKFSILLQSNCGDFTKLSGTEKVGLIKGKTKLKNIKEYIIPRLKNISGIKDIKITQVCINLKDLNNIKFYNTNDYINDNKILLGTYDVNILINELLKLGINENDIKIHNNIHPIIINIPNCTITIDNKHHTIIDTNNQQLRNNIINILQNILTCI